MSHEERTSSDVVHLALLLSSSFMGAYGDFLVYLAILPL